MKSAVVKSATNAPRPCCAGNDHAAEQNEQGEKRDRLLHRATSRTNCIEARQFPRAGTCTQGSGQLGVFG
jgi:hypothetical protein